MRYYTTLWNWVQKVPPNFYYSVTIFYVNMTHATRKWWFYLISIQCVKYRIQITYVYRLTAKSVKFMQQELRRCEQVTPWLAQLLGATAVHNVQQSIVKFTHSLNESVQLTFEWISIASLVAVWASKFHKVIYTPCPEKNATIFASNFAKC